jgi:SAM-dependent methyltransferase
MNEVKYIPYQHNIYSLFQEAFARDKSKYIRDWTINWEYQAKRKKRKVKYSGDYNQDFHVYQDPSELLKWFNWLYSQPKPDYFPEAQMQALVRQSHAFDQIIANNIHVEVNWELHDSLIGRNNAQDYFLANLYPHPVDTPDPVVLDFGAGYGRQANLWLQQKPLCRYIGMDAIAKSYCLQHLYYAYSGKLVYDYVVQHENLTFASPGVYHLPTWRRDLIPDNSVDKILAIQVMQELGGQIAKEMISTFHRILKPSGALYIRDSDSSWRPAHKLNLNKLLLEAGFTLEYKAHIVDKKDLLGIPRIWRKTNPAVLKQEHIGLKQRLYEIRLDIDAFTRGKLKDAIKSIFGP